MGVYQIGKSWYFDFVSGGVRYKESVGKVNKTVAKEKETIRRREVIQGEYKPKTVSMLFKNFTPKYIETEKTKVRPATLKRKQTSINMLLPFFGSTPLEKINTFMFERYKKERRDKHRQNKKYQSEITPATLNRDYETLRNILNKAVTWKYLRENPLSGYDKDDEDNEKMWCLSCKEEKKLLKACEDSPQREKYLKDMVLLALNTGMREGEIFNLMKSDVDQNNRIVIVRKTKNGEPRNVPLNNTALEIVTRRMERKNTEYIFCNAEGKKLTVLTNAYWHAVKKASLHRYEEVRGENKEVRFRFHDLRHTFCSRLGMAGVDIKTLMEISGHKTYKMVLRYQHPAPEHKQNAVNILDEVTLEITPEENENGENVNDIDAIAV